jgi:uncharacterized protein YbjT (DUF2867 family)
MEATRRIAVAGATGRVGSHVVDVLEEAGHEVVPISRAHGVDVLTGDGLAEALAGSECVVDAATSPSADEEEAARFFTTATRNLHEIGQAAGVQRIVVVSIIATERFKSGYGAAKIVHERAALDGPLPATILRAAQFHEFVEQLIDWGRDGDVSYVPRMRTQLVAARTVAEALVELALDPMAADSLIPEIAGPREESLVEAASLLAATRADPARVEPVSFPDAATAGLYESGALLPGPRARRAGPTFEAWLGSRRPQLRSLGSQPSRYRAGERLATRAYASAA